MSTVDLKKKLKTRHTEVCPEFKEFFRYNDCIDWEGRDFRFFFFNEENDMTFYLKFCPFCGAKL